MGQLVLARCGVLGERARGRCRTPRRRLRSGSPRNRQRRRCRPRPARAPGSSAGGGRSPAAASGRAARSSGARCRGRARRRAPRTSTSSSAIVRAARRSRGEARSASPYESWTTARIVVVRRALAGTVCSRASMNSSWCMSYLVRERYSTKYESAWPDGGVRHDEDQHGRSRTRLSRERVLRARRWPIADAGGLTSLTIRSLADEPGRQADVGLLPRRQQGRDPRRHRRPRLRRDRSADRRRRLARRDAPARAVGAHRCCRRHPWAIALLESRTAPVRRPCATTTPSSARCARQASRAS